MTLIITNKINILNEKDRVNQRDGIKDQIINTKIKLKKGIRLNKCLVSRGIIVLLLNNLIASAIGCTTPINAGLLGPRRSCE